MHYFDEYDLEVTVTTAIAEMGGNVEDKEQRARVLEQIKQLLDAVDRSTLWAAYSEYTNEVAYTLGLEFAIWQNGGLPISDREHVFYYSAALSKGLRDFEKANPVPLRLRPVIDCIYSSYKEELVDPLLETTKNRKACDLEIALEYHEITDQFLFDLDISNVGRVTKNLKCGLYCPVEIEFNRKVLNIEY